MITSKADLRRWGQLVNVIEFTTSIKMCVKGNTDLGPFYAIFLTLSIPNISDKNKLLEANSIEPTKEFLNSLPDCF